MSNVVEKHHGKTRPSDAEIGLHRLANTRDNTTCYFVNDESVNQHK